MIRMTLLSAAVLITIPLLSPAKEFPLEFKTLKADEVMSFPGGYGSSGELRLDKQQEIKQEPAAVSAHPLYGRFFDNVRTNFVLYRLDESKGDGKGYDRLVIDRNQNRDLTDDEAIKAVETPETHKGAVRNTEVVMFGPFEMPVEHIGGEWRAVYFAQMYLHNRELLGSTQTRDRQYLGQLRLKAGWYLETRVEMDGNKQRVGIVDGNANLRLFDISTARFHSTKSRDDTWYFLPGDSWLQDADGSGQFENDLLGAESCAFGSVLYFGSKPYTSTLSANCKSIRVEPWSKPLAELTLQPHGDQVCSLTLACLNQAGQWQLLKLGVANGKVRVPSGDYRLYSCSLRVKDPSGDSLTLSGYKRAPKDTTTAKAGVPVPFQCGSPLAVTITSERDKRRDKAATDGSQSRLGEGSKDTAGSEEPLKQLIQASVLGAGGEMYSSFVLGDKSNRREPPKPTYTIAASDGEQIATGKMEFG